MIQIYFIQPDGAVNEAMAEHGQTLLSVAKESGIDGFTVSLPAQGHMPDKVALLGEVLSGV